MKTPKLVETSLGASSHVGCSSSPLSSPSHVTVLPFASCQAPVHARSHIGVRSVDAGFSRRHASAGDWPTQIEGNHSIRMIQTVRRRRSLLDGDDGWRENATLAECRTGVGKGLRNQGADGGGQLAAGRE